MESKNLKRLSKLLKTDVNDFDNFLIKSKPDFIDFSCHMLHSFKKHANPDVKKHITKILKSKTARIAKSRMRKAHEETKGGFFDFFKKAGNSVVDMSKRFGNQVATTASSWWDSGKDYAKKGLEYAKPYIKEYGPSLAGKAASMIPVVGNIAQPIVKKGAELLANRFLKDKKKPDYELNPYLLID